MTTPYEQLAARLDELPNGFPPAPDGAEIKLLKKIFTPDEAELAACLRSSFETPQEIAARISEQTGKVIEIQALKSKLKYMTRKGLIKAGKTQNGLGYGLMPFVVGIYEAQVGRIDAELAQRFEDYYTQSFGKMLTIQPSYHRVIPVGESVRMDMEVRPFESASEIINHAQAWGVLDCICRKQKSLIGDPCPHPLDVCMIFSQRAGAFDSNETIRAVTQEEALATLKRAAKAGLVHSVSNTSHGLHYICNCCTCSCGILRGMADLGIANVVARSAFVNQVHPDLCSGCETCITSCQFSALAMGDLYINIDETRCAGCGVCIPMCPENALFLIRRPENEVLPIPETESEWLSQRAIARDPDMGATP